MDICVKIIVQYGFHCHGCGGRPADELMEASRPIPLCSKRMWIINTYTNLPFYLLTYLLTYLLSIWISLWVTHTIHITDSCSIFQQRKKSARELETKAYSVALYRRDPLFFLFQRKLENRNSATQKSHSTFKIGFLEITKLPHAKKTKQGECNCEDRRRGTRHCPFFLLPTIRSLFLVLIVVLEVCVKSKTCR